MPVGKTFMLFLYLALLARQVLSPGLSSRLRLSMVWEETQMVRRHFNPKGLIKNPPCTDFFELGALAFLLPSAIVGFAFVTRTRPSLSVAYI